MSISFCPLSNNDTCITDEVIIRLFHSSFLSKQQSYLYLSLINLTVWYYPLQRNQLSRENENVPDVGVCFLYQSLHKGVMEVVSKLKDSLDCDHVAGLKVMNTWARGRQAQRYHMG